MAFVSAESDAWCSNEAMAWMLLLRTTLMMVTSNAAPTTMNCARL